VTRPRLLLLFPPQASPVFPHLALPALTAAARAAGIDAVQADLNLAFYRRVFDPGFLARTLSRATATSGEQGSASGADGFRRSLLVGLGRQAVAALPDALRVLDGAEGFYSFSRYTAAVHDLQSILRLIGETYGAQEIGLGGGVLRYSERSSAEVARSLDDREGNPYLDVLSEPLADLLETTAPDCVGVSVTYTAQLVAAFSLAGLIRRFRPNCKIILGGNTVTHLGTRLSQSPLAGLADALVLGEGEETLPALVWAFHRGEDVSGMDGTATAADPVGRPAVVRNLSALPTPCFDGLDPGAYLAPEPILPVQLSRGCYWGKCSFCNYNVVYGSGYRSLSPARATEILRELTEAHGVRAVVMTDSVISPSLLLQTADLIRRQGLSLAWDASIRVEPALVGLPALTKLREAGCRLLHFGLESAVPRVLDLMHKGTDADLAGRLIEAANAAGIWTKALLFFGFPGETEEEARRTMAFVQRYSRKLQAVSPGVEFTVTPGSPVLQSPESFGVGWIDLDPNHDLALAYAHESARGLSRAEITALAAEFTRWVKAQAVSPASTLFYPILGGHDLLYAAHGGVEGIGRLKGGQGDTGRTTAEGTEADTSEHPAFTRH
jgi:anaerobic magnesium-protoporphyrin IX monomethyl ester cyclase